MFWMLIAPTALIGATPGRSPTTDSATSCILESLLDTPGLKPQWWRSSTIMTSNNRLPLISRIICSLSILSIPEMGVMGARLSSLSLPQRWVSWKPYYHPSHYYGPQCLSGFKPLFGCLMLISFAATLTAITNSVPFEAWILSQRQSTP